MNNNNVFKLLDLEIKYTENNIKGSADKIKKLRNDYFPKIKETLDEISNFEATDENGDILENLFNRYKIIRQKDNQLDNTLDKITYLMNEISVLDRTLVQEINDIKIGIDLIDDEDSKKELLSKYEKLVEVYEGFFNIPWVNKTSKYINQLFDYSESLQNDFQNDLSEIRDVLYEKVRGFNE